MLDTEPAGKPFSGPQNSLKYCDKARFTSAATPGTTKQANTNPVTAPLHSWRPLRPPSRKIFKLLNYDLGGFLQRILVAGDDEKYEPRLGFTR